MKPEEIDKIMENLDDNNLCIIRNALEEFEEQKKIRTSDMFAVKTLDDLNKYIQSIPSKEEKRVAYLIYGLTWNAIAHHLFGGKEE